jgi:galactosylgalactosylxylosylprotein 3-beta-glucuronosyltransferase 3
LTYYELEEKYADLNTQFDALNTYVNRFGNISYPISYSLKFYEKLFDLPTIYVITPTNSRADTQLADLTRLRNTLWLVPKLFWIVVEDARVKTKKVEQFMASTAMPSVHLNEETTEDLVVKSSENSWAKPRGVLQRNKGLEWLRANAGQLDLNGVVYFADDDNSYDIRLFEEMRYTKKVSVWPVAFVGELLYERPICADDKVFFFINLLYINLLKQLIFKRRE